MRCQTSKITSLPTSPEEHSLSFDSFIQDGNVKLKSTLLCCDIIDVRPCGITLQAQWVCLCFGWLVGSLVFSLTSSHNVKTI